MIPQKVESHPYEAVQYSDTIYVLPGDYLYKIDTNITIRTIKPKRFEGQCVTWVKKRTGFNYPVGIARNTLSVARQNNIPTGLEPRVGAIVVIDSPNYAGHSAVVERVYINKIVISESNFLAPNVYSERELDINDGEILGYVYYGV